MNSLSLITAFIVNIFLVCTVAGQNRVADIRINQIGFYPDSPKEAVIVGAAADGFNIIDVSSSEVVYSGTLGSEEFWEFSGETVRLASFSSLQEPGTYALEVEGVGTSYPFIIHTNVHRTIGIASLKAYYFQRMSTTLTSDYADRWARPQGHPDRNVFIHPSAATAERPANTQISAPYGWYDAGDFNKYVVNSGISTYTLLALYEHYTSTVEGIKTDIPESNNEVPDILDEALWNLRWMMAMQDPGDGGVYHKLTHANFQGIIMPHVATAPRYVVQKGTAAALNFAAVMAQAARVYDSYERVFPGLADSMQTAALHAWNWARNNPNVVYNQNAMNQAFDPNIVTGEYGGSNFEDEFDWAAAELFVTTQADSFLTIATPLDNGPDIPWWGGVRTLGWFTLLHHREQIASVVDTTSMVNQYLGFARDLAASRNQVPYRTVMGGQSWHFGWGSNSAAANQGMALLQAFRLSADSTFLWAAVSNLDYLLGRNAIGMSFVTGYGSSSPMHPHHRQSEADSVDEPIPGLLVGGPNPGQEDGCTYVSNLPARSYVDDWCSYASNEVTINWNAPFAYLALGLEAAIGGEVVSTHNERSDRWGTPPSILRPPYPNPAIHETTLHLSLNEQLDPVLLEAFDVLGRRIANWRIAPGDGEQRIAWDMKDLPDGLYFVRLQAGKQAWSQKVVKVGN